MSALSPRQMFALDQACKPILEAFEDTPYLVGTAAKRQPYRDVDVRLILDDAKYRALQAVAPDLLPFLGIVIGDYLATATGLPIDFQVQQQTAANVLHPGGWRNPLGLRKLRNYVGDAVPAPVEDATDLVEFEPDEEEVGAAAAARYLEQHADELGPAAAALSKQIQMREGVHLIARKPKESQDAE